MTNYEINKTVLVAKKDNPFAVMGEAFKISAVSIDSATGENMIVVQNLNLDQSNTDFTPESFGVKEERLSQLFEVAEETVEELNFPNFNKVKEIKLSDLEESIFGRILTEEERQKIMGEMGVAVTTQQMVSGPKDLVGELLTPIMDFDTFVVGEEYKLIDIAVGEYLKEIVYVFQQGNKIISFKTQRDISDFFTKKD